jgi:hypothetical protein
LIGIVIAVNTHRAVHVIGFVNTSVVHTLPSLHEVGHLPVPVVIAVSQVSPASTTPLPQLARQSLSVALFAPGGQQPSLLIGIVMAVCMHAAWQLFGFIRTSVVHACMSSQFVGHAPAPATMPVSQTSPGSRMPLPHIAVQSVSVFAFAPLGQQPSPSVGAVMSVCRQTAVHAEPLITSVVHT